MSDPSTPPFERSHFIDKPGIVGARWWQESLNVPDPMARRQAIGAILVATGVVAGLGAILAIGAAASDDEPEVTTSLRDSLEMQRQFGWNFGATSESLTFDGRTRQAFDRSALDRMVTDFAPAQVELRRHSSTTLFQAPSAMPHAVPEGDASTFKPLRDALVPIFTYDMDVAYRRGRALSSLFEGAPRDILVIIDLPGPIAVAFAAGMADRFDPCFAFENWPHPRGVVPAHLTLAAAAYYQPLFARTQGTRKALSPAMLVLDGNRLASYTDDATQFDNRYAAKVPSAGALRAMLVKHVLYVAPVAGNVELGDLNDDFIAYAADGIDVKIVAANDFGPDPRRLIDPTAPGTPNTPSDEPKYFYGGDEQMHWGFWNNYPWNPGPHPASQTPMSVSNGYAYVPRARVTGFSATVKPTGFGMVPVIVAAGTGAILGAKMSRSGSWLRGSSGS